MNHHLKKVSEESSPEVLARRLEEFFERGTGAIIAYSGGVDSSLLAYAAHRALGNRMLAVLADSPSLSRREYGSAVVFAERHRIPLRVVQTEELEDPLYRENRADRCYHCKKDLFQKLKDLKKRLKQSDGSTEWPLFFGMNLDDLRDHRPGHRAAAEAGVSAPYVELGFNKENIRSVCAYYGLEEIAVKAASPCMSSRIAYGESVTPEKLLQVEKAEDLLYDLGLKVYRVRHHGSSARIEVRPEDFSIVLDKRERILESLHALGFAYVSLDLDGFKSGSLNAVLKRKEKG